MSCIFLVTAAATSKCTAFSLMHPNAEFSLPLTASSLMLVIATLWDICIQVLLVLPTQPADMVCHETLGILVRASSFSSLMRGFALLTYPDSGLTLSWWLSVSLQRFYLNCLLWQWHLVQDDERRHWSLVQMRSGMSSTQSWWSQGARMTSSELKNTWEHDMST